MTPTEYINSQAPERQAILSGIHAAILENDNSVEATVGKMMGKDIILYNNKAFKYGLASVKEHMSLHAMPIYMWPHAHEKYGKLLPKAKLQKGCINFKSADEMPLDVVVELIKDCAPFDLATMIAERDKAKKKKK